MFIFFIFNPITLLLLYIGYAKTTGKLRLFFEAIGAVVDFVVNQTWFMVIFWDLPKELLLTNRIERLTKDAGRRGKLARLLCKLLNYFQPNHCKG